MTTHPTSDSFAAVATRRKSCRAFRDEALSWNEQERLLTLAQTAASWCNTQPWMVTVVQGPALRELSRRLKEAVRASGPTWDIEPPTHYPGVFGDRRRAAGYGLYDSVGIARGDHIARVAQAERNFEFFGAPHTAIVSVAQTLGDYSLVDVGSYIATFLLAAESLGMGAIAQASVAMHSHVVRDALGIGGDWTVVCALSYGWPSDSAPVNNLRTERASLSEVVKVVDSLGEKPTWLHNSAASTRPKVSTQHQLSSTT